MKTASGMNELHPEGVLKQATMRPTRVHSKERLVSSRWHTAYSACNVCQHAVVSISSVYSLSETYLLVISLLRSNCGGCPAPSAPSIQELHDYSVLC